MARVGSSIMQGIICNLLFLGLFFGTCVHGWSILDSFRSADPIVKPIVGRFDHSEGPHWDYRTHTLYFVDIEAQKICRYGPLLQTLSCINIEDGPIGFAIPVEGESNKLVAGVGKDFMVVEWNGRDNFTKSAPQILDSVDADQDGNRWNDGKADSSGRFWGGTIGKEVNDVVKPKQAAFYRIDSDQEPIKELTVTNSNGLAWNLEDDTLYYIDTPTLQVAAFDYNATDGTISNKRIVFDFKKQNISGMPDGMTIDTDGNLWIAAYSGGAVINADPRTGKVKRIVKLPVDKVTSCTFGGELMDILYVTTSSRGLSKEQLKKQPYAGYVFAIYGLGVNGFYANSFKL